MTDPTHRIFLKFRLLLFKLQCILSQKLLKKIQIITNEKIFHVYKAFDHKKLYQSYGFEDFPCAASGKRLSV